ncbi:hypothetical protein VDGE_04310 [Verticillium dahliae]|uniref:Uncharacterized protein n=1 Tax=Verticillium dahliae TaxID=27337 RepID=A0A444S3A4_VERDA|nr:hypothetical protein VDGE_04310 [Verticillium dahliae]
MSSDEQTKICLGVAVDHRIQRLCKTTPHGLAGESDHVASIKEEGRALRRPREEIAVTAELAGPAYKGGIAVMLQQPRKTHPYDKGIDAVIEDCESLLALYEVFDVASRGSLDIRTNVSVVDLLPFVSASVDSLSDAYLAESFKASTQVICDKEPDVLLCAGKIWLPRAGKFDDRKGDAWKFESVGLGTQFGSTPKLPITARVRHGSKGLVAIPRVNGFHPSHAMNYLSHVSLLRQLQALIGVETCGTLRGDWEDEEWMGDIRKRCQNISQSLTGHSPSKSAALQSPGQSSGRYNRNKYLPEWQEMYSDTLLSLKMGITSLLANPDMAKKSPETPYRILLASGLSETCNDLALVLTQISRCVERGWPESVAWKNEASLRALSSDTLLLSETVLKAAKKAQRTGFAEIAVVGMKIIARIDNKSRDKDAAYKYGMDPNELRKNFTKMAVHIESLLLDLLEKKEDALNALGQEDYLSSLMDKVSITPSSTRNEYRRSSGAVRSGW